MYRFFLDIETLPAVMDDAEKAALVSAPANYKDPEKIAAWIADNAESEYRKTSFDPLSGRLLCVGYAYGDEDVRVAYDASGEGAIFDELHAALVNRQAPIWVGHSVAGFDLLWLKLHALKQRHPIAPLIPFAKWDKRVEDTKEMAAGPDPRNGRKLSDLARFFDIGEKGSGLDGSKVYDAWLAGEHERIAAYCAQDVALTRSLHRILKGESAAMEGAVCVTLRKRKVFRGIVGAEVRSAFLQDLQCIHDNHNPENWPERLRLLAVRDGLDATILVVPRAK